MIKKIKKPISILLSVLMVLSLFAVVPFTASAAVGDLVPESEYLTFTAEEAGSSVTLNFYSGSNLKYNKNNSGWVDYTKGAQIDLENAGDSVRFRGNNTTFNNSNHVSIGGKVACSGNVMSLRLDDTDKVQGLSNKCFEGMFTGCTGLTAAPKLPETKLADNCYSYMFSGCTSLTTAPALPATTLTTYCYNSMFDGCESLTTAPALPATTLAVRCYNYMFSDCKSLTTAPALPATTLATHCYYGMFYGCTSLTAAPALPATELVTNCYASMFNGCTGIKLSTTQTAEYSIPYSVPSGGNGTTTATNALNNMFANTGGTFTGKPEINKTYYVPAPATTTFKVYVKKLTNETYTIENLTGETTVAQLKEIIAAKIDIPATAQRLIFSGKELDDAKTLAEYNIGNESTIHLVMRGYTVTWLNYDNSELDTTTVQYGATPSYDGTPERPEDDDNTYTFSGWKNGETTYAPDALPAVSGEVTYTAVYTAEPKIPAPQLPDVIAGCTYYDSYYGVYANVPFAEMLIDIKDGAIIFDNYSDTCIMDTKDYSYKFYDQTGTELEAVLTESYDSDGYGYRVIMNVFSFSNPVSGPLYIVATAPAPAKLITGQSITLDGNIGINFYLDPAAAGLTVEQVTKDNLSYTFAWADAETTHAKVDVAAQAAQKNFRVSEDGKYIIVTCHVCAAEMTCDVNATFTLDGITESKTESKTYSVREYCNTVIKPKTEWLTAYKTKYPDGTAKCYYNLKELVKAMLHYGAMAQTKFKVNTGYLANQNVTYEKGDVTGTMIDTAIAAANGNKTADDMNAVAAALGAKWFSTSLIYLDDSTLRHYFVKDTDAFNSSAYTGNKSNYYYYVEVSGIAAAELDNLQSFTAGTESFKYSALDFVKGMITSSADEDSKNLAKSLYWYNQEANEYFPAPAEKILVLDDVNEDTTVEDGYTITGTLQGDYKISIADGATVTLRDVDITCLTNGAKYAGITLAGDATINLEGANTVKGGYEDYAGVYVPEGKTLTIDGTGSLDASSNGYGCGIGAGNNGKPAGNIVINGGTITAIGGDMSAGIGGSHKSNCGDITITGGTVYAESLGRAPGIGAGHGFYGSRCGNITISGGSVTAIGESYGSGIGTGLRGVCGAILITAGVTQVTATKGSNAPNSIGAGKDGTCGTVTIENGANVTQN